MNAFSRPSHRVAFLSLLISKLSCGSRSADILCIYMKVLTYIGFVKYGVYYKYFQKVLRRLTQLTYG